ncbi:MAG TPA: ATP-binding protein [Stenomitos sp.]
MQQELETTRLNPEQFIAQFEQLKLQSLNRNFHLQVLSQPDSLTEAMDWFDQLYRPEIPLRTWIEFQTIFGEAFDNALSHAHAGLPAETPIDLEITILDQILVLQIWDFGPGFDYKKHILRLDHEPSLMAESGRGTSIMMELGDFFTYTPTSDRRNVFLIAKSFIAEGKGIPLVSASGAT